MLQSAGSSLAIHWTMVDPSSVYHEGELAVQNAAGEEGVARRNAAAIAGAVMAGARPFLRAQRMLAVATRDAGGRPWASLVFGRAGCVFAGDDGRHVTIEGAMVYAGDA